MARFEKTYCSQCGGEFGPGDSGFSHCSSHSTPADVRHNPMISRDAIYHLIANTRTCVAKRSYERVQNWALVMDMFGCGSTRAHEICLFAGIDPDARTAGPRQQPPPHDPEGV